MNPKQTVSQPPPMLNLGDIYYVVFRRKWLILGVSLAGFIAAALTSAEWHTTYSSQAELDIPYLVDKKNPGVGGADVSVTQLDNRGLYALRTEMMLMMSFNRVLVPAAINVGPVKILAKQGGGTNAIDAASIIRKNLLPDNPIGTTIVTLTYSDDDPTLVQPVLEQVITNYIQEHIKVHTGTGVDVETIRHENDLLKNRLTETENQLAKAKTDSGVVDLVAAMSAYTAQEGALKQEYQTAMNDLADSQAVAARLQSNFVSAPLTASNAATNHSTNSANSIPPALPPPSRDVVAAYQKAIQSLQTAQSKSDDLQTRYNTNNALVQGALLEVASAQDAKKRLEDANPALLTVASTGFSSIPAEVGRPSTPESFDPHAMYNMEVTRIVGLEARLNSLTNQLQLIEEKGTNLNQLQVTLQDLDRERQTEEEYLRKVSSSLDETKINTEMDAENANIQIIQNPTPPAPDTKKSYKAIESLAIGGVVLGFALAFLVELVLDRTFRRPQEVVNRLKLPFFLSIPYMKNGNGKPGGKGKLPPPQPTKETKLLPASPALPGAALPESRALAPAHDSLIAPWDEKHALRPFYETLRDRLIAYFEMINLTHKPKLVAVTSCDEGAGVSTIACGLASSLSETGDGNVLLVNMNVENGEAHQFYKGKLAIGLDGALEKEKRDGALVHDNLYVVNESSNRDKLPGVLPKRFGHLVSKLKASDYDYIILDMPPVTQISVTPRLARFMDMVLLVVESGKTDREAAQRATSLLSESRANVGVLMNKSRSYGPKRLQTGI